MCFKMRFEFVLEIELFFVIWISVENYLFKIFLLNLSLDELGLTCH